MEINFQTLYWCSIAGRPAIYRGLSMKVKKLIVMVIFIVLLLPQYIVRAAASDEQGIEEFIEKLYEAKEEGKEDLLLSMGASEVQIMSDLALVECGLQEYHKLQSYIYQSSENTWLVIVGYEMEVEDVDVWIPGMVSEYVIKDEQGQFMLPWQTEEIPSMVNKHAELTMTVPKIAGMFKACNDSYIQILQNDISGEVQDFQEKLEETYAGMAEEHILMTEKNRQNDKSAKNGTNQSYTVRQGDSLWSISEEYLESGQNWRLLYQKNRKIIGEFPDLIFPGQQLDLNING